MTYLTLAARNMLVQVPEIKNLITSGRLGRSNTWQDGWIFDSKPYAPPIEKYSAKSLVVVSMAGTWQTPNGHNTAHFPRLFVDIWASPTRAEDGSPLQDDADMLIEDVWAAMRPYLHTLDMAVPGISGGPISPYQGLPGLPRIWGTAEQIAARTGVVVLDSQQLDEPDLSDVRDGNGARMGRYSVGVYTV